MKLNEEMFDWLNANCRGDIVEAIQEIIDDKVHRNKLMRRHRRPKEVQTMIDEIVGFYMTFVTHHRGVIQESLEYSWSCMSKGTIEDYLDSIREERQVNLTDKQIEQIFRKHYGGSNFESVKLEFIKDLLRHAQYRDMRETYE